MNTKDDQATKEASIGQIIIQFWNGVKTMKSWFFFSYILFLIAHLVNLFIPLYYKNFFDLITKPAGLNNAATILTQIVITIFVLHMINWIFFRVAMFTFDLMEVRVMARLKQNAFDYMIEYSHTFFANNFSGGLVQKVGRFSRAFESLADSLAFNLMPLVITVIGSIWIMWTIAPIVSIIMIVWVLAVSTLSITFSTWKMKFDKSAAEADSHTTGYLADAITNNNAITFFTGHEYESKGFRDVSNEQAKKTLFSWRLAELVDGIQVLLIFLVELVSLRSLPQVPVGKFENPRFSYKLVS